MVYQYILANLLAKNDGAVGVLFVDDSGETIDVACSDFSPYQMRVVGAYIGIYLRQAQQFLEEIGQGGPSLLHVEKEALHLYARPLPEGYFVLLVQRSPGLTGCARRTLDAACEQLTKELFESA
jgi:predicted regulator of Ras-like GTPase activity (Roadblock/LC7/MglB family)